VLYLLENICLLQNHHTHYDAFLEDICFLQKLLHIDIMFLWKIYTPHITIYYSIYLMCFLIHRQLPVQYYSINVILKIYVVLIRYYYDVMHQLI
jgi:hypothetical protein